MISILWGVGVVGFWGFGFFNYGIIDTHFSQRGRQGRITSLALETGVRFAFGVDE